MSNLMTPTPLQRITLLATHSLCAFALFPGLAQASQYWCAAGDPWPEPAMKVYHDVNYVNPVNSVPLRNIVSNMVIDMPIVCGGGKPGDTFKVYRTTRMQAGMDNQTCQLSQPNGQQVLGIGVRLRNGAGRALLCNDPAPNPRNLVFEMESKSTKPRVVVGFKLPVAVEYIRTADPINLAPGLHTLEFPLTNSFVAVNSQGTVQQDWGIPYAKVHSSSLVSTCALAQINTPVPFGRLTIDQLHNSERAFSINLKDCGNTTAANLFNGLISMRFYSSTQLPDGTLGNKVCDGCAKGVAIEVLNDNGVRVDLTQKYKMSAGTFSVTADTIEQRFKARLIATGPITGGEINGLLTFEFTSN